MSNTCWKYIKQSNFCENYFEVNVILNLEEFCTIHSTSEWDNVPKKYDSCMTINEVFNVKFNIFVLNQF